MEHAKYDRPFRLSSDRYPQVNLLYLSQANWRWVKWSMSGFDLTWSLCLAICISASLDGRLMCLFGRRARSSQEGQRTRTCESKRVLRPSNVASTVAVAQPRTSIHSITLTENARLVHHRSSDPCRLTSREAFRMQVKTSQRSRTW